MRKTLALFLIIGTVILLPEVLGHCNDVDKTACGMLLAADSNMCQNPCLAQICKETCGACSLDCFFCDSELHQNECYATVECKPQSELCIATKRLSVDQQYLFSSGCASKEICNTLFSGNSSTSLNHGHTLTVFNGVCCGTDRCNKDPDANKTVSDVVDRSVDYQINDKIVVRKADNLLGDRCSDFDVNSVACTILYNADPTICRKDCIGRELCPETCGTCVRCKTCKHIADPALCNNITLCAKSESCFSKERLNVDFSISYDLGCMNDVICHAYFGGIPDSDITKTQVSFGGSVQCCKSNLCNAKGLVLKNPAVG
ncbi:uncharacterized protein LOC134687485 [Mytilus trossulus]|uniref:uncharacterized protein LOC134687485 n=1 Tax=Mytilus trossulus TaxID=6551 RepID=UPI0030043DAC